MGMPTCHLQYRAPSARLSVTFHQVINYWYITTLLVALLSTANGNKPPDIAANYVTQNGNTDKNVDINYDTQTNNYPSNQALYNDDIMFEPTTASLTSSLINYDTQTNNYPSNQALYNDDIMFEPTTASLTSSLINYDTQTNNYPSNQALHNDDIMYEPTTASLTSSLNNYDTQTNNYPSSQALHDDNIMYEPTTASLTSLIKNDQTITLYEPSAVLTPKTEYESTATTYPMTQTLINVDNKITTRHTSRAKQPKMVEHSKASTTSLLHFAPTTPISFHVCHTRYLEVTNIPVQVIATIRNRCNNLYVTAPNNTSIAIRLINSSVNHISTYFYIENVGTPPQDCTDRYVLVSVEHTPCTAIIGGSQFRFHFQNSDMLIEMRTLDVQISTCF